MSLRIAYVNVARGFRGGERQTELLVRALAESPKQGPQGGLEQVLVARRGEALAQRARGAKVELREVSGGALGVARALAGVDLVHVHEGRSVYAAYLRSLWSRTPYLVTRRVNNPLGQHWLARRCYRKAATVAAVAQDIADIVKSYDPTISTRVIHSSSSALESDPRTAASIKERAGGSFLVGHVGALDNQQKGQEYILQVARKLQDSRPSIRFLLVGGGADEVMLRDSARGLTNLSFAGFVDNVGDYLASFDAFILPSNKEGIGAILLDAMGFGLPVVASRVGGLPEIVHDDFNGILIDPARPDQLEAAILRLADDRQLCARLGAAGRKFATGCTPQAMANSYLDLYRSICEGRGLAGGQTTACR